MSKWNDSPNPDTDCKTCKAEDALPEVPPPAPPPKKCPIVVTGDEFIMALLRYYYGCDEEA
ncbi:MAG: hypothetical protein DRI37_04990 [Chloroflexi bacterium]|nr:MAG: hypothetical protein DRI37_04990 [Chloroflexota bacterium]